MIAREAGLRFMNVLINTLLWKLMLISRHIIFFLISVEDI